MTSVVVLFAKKVYIVDQKILSWRHFSQHNKIEKVENDPENDMTNVMVLWFLIVIQVNDCNTLVNNTGLILVKLNVLFVIQLCR